MSIGAAPLIPSMSRNDEPKVTTTGLLGLSVLRCVTVNDKQNQCSLCEVAFCCLDFKALMLSENMSRCILLDCSASSLDNRHTKESSVKTSSLAHAILFSQIDVNNEIADIFCLDFSLFWLSCQLCSCK